MNTEESQNREYLEQTDGGWEIGCYTPAGGDMWCVLDGLTRADLQEYIDNFDINDEVLLWWQPHQTNTTPFANLRDHYNDLEEWLDNLQSVCDGMPH